MPNFNYVAIDKGGRQSRGKVEAMDIERATAKIKAEGLFVVDVAEENAFNKDINISIGSGVKPRDLSVFCRQFVSMLGAGVTIIDALAMLSEQSESKELGKALKQIQGDVEKGETLSDAMAKREKIFTSLMVRMIAAGEASGSLETSFERMAAQFEKAAKLSGLIKKAIIYPIVVAIVAVVVVIVMLTTVIPNYTSMFAELGTELPGITKAVIAASDFIIGYWYVLIAVIAAVVMALKMYGRTDAGQITFGTIGYKVPLFGNLTIKSASSQFARTLSTLLAAGVPMIEALDIVGSTMGNALFRNAIKKAKEEVAKGVPLSEPLESCGLFPPMVYHMTRIGEETGDIEAMLDRLADYYDEEVEVATQSLMAALEPMIIIVLALVVGTLVMSVMAPMLSMYQALDQL